MLIQREIAEKMSTSIILMLIFMNKTKTSLILNHNQRKYTKSSNKVCKDTLKKTDSFILRLAA